MEKHFLTLDDTHNLRTALDNYQPHKIFIRESGSRGGQHLVDEHLQGRTLDFIADEELHFLIDGKEVYACPFVKIGTRKECGFTLCYDRRDDNGKMIFPTGIVNPYDSELPEPRTSILTHILDTKLLKIYFPGRIHVEQEGVWGSFPLWRVIPNEY